LFFFVDVITSTEYALNIVPGYDVLLDSLEPTSNLIHNNYVLTTSSGRTTWMLMKFFLNSIPKEATIIHAKLRQHVLYNTGEATLQTWNTTSDWVSHRVNWNNKSLLLSLLSINTVPEKLNVGCGSQLGNSPYIDIDLTSSIKQIYQEKDTLDLIQFVTNTDKVLQLFGVTDIEEELRPTIKITYTINKVEL